MARLDNAGHTFLLVEQLGGILLAGSVTVADLVKNTRLDVYHGADLLERKILQRATFHVRGWR